MAREHFETWRQSTEPRRQNVFVRQTVPYTGEKGLRKGGEWMQSASKGDGKGPGKIAWAI